MPFQKIPIIIITAKSKVISICVLLFTAASILALARTAVASATFNFRIMFSLISELRCNDRSDACSLLDMNLG
jgi:hypothetical protein